MTSTRPYSGAFASKVLQKSNEQWGASKIWIGPMLHSAAGRSVRNVALSIRRILVGLTFGMTNLANLVELTIDSVCRAETNRFREG